MSIEIEGVGSITWEWLMSDNSTDWPEFAWIRIIPASRHSDLDRFPVLTNGS